MGKYIPHVTLMALFFSKSTLAASPFGLTDEEGFSGYVATGARHITVQSNSIADDKYVKDLPVASFSDSADSQTNLTYSFSADLKYTIRPERLQAYLSADMEDPYEFDLYQHAGINYSPAKRQIYTLGLAFTGIPRDVWRDPYESQNIKESTQRKSYGVRLGYDSGSIIGFDASLTYRDISVGSDQSGLSYSENISQIDSSVLDRNGNVLSTRIAYKLPLSRNQLIKPSIYSVDTNLSGKAASYKRYGLGLGHTYISENWKLFTNIQYGEKVHNAENPILGDVSKSREYAFVSRLMLSNCLGIEDISCFALYSYAHRNSNVDFDDSFSSGISIGTAYSF